MGIVNLSAPWIEYYRKIQAMFDLDPGVNVVYDAKDMAINLYVNNKARAEALSEILVPVREYGNVSLTINVIPGLGAPDVEVRRVVRYGRLRSETSNNVFSKALAQTDHLYDIVETYGVGGLKCTFVIFDCDVAQYFNDDTSDYYGLRSILYADIAKEIFKPTDGTFFCTDRKRSKGEM